MWRLGIGGEAAVAFRGLRMQILYRNTITKAASYNHGDHLCEAIQRRFSILQ